MAALLYILKVIDNTRGYSTCRTMRLQEFFIKLLSMKK